MNNELRLVKKAVQTRDGNTLKKIFGLTPYKTDLLCQALLVSSGLTGIATNREANADPEKRGIYARKWQNTPTRTIRVPTVLADDILRIAHEIDAGIDYKTELETIIANHQAKKKGYYGSNITELIEDLKALI